MNKDATLAFYYYWDGEDFKYWTREGHIPPELLAPSRAVELYEYLFNNRSFLFSKLLERTRCPYAY